MSKQAAENAVWEAAGDCCGSDVFQVGCGRWQAQRGKGIRSERDKGIRREQSETSVNKFPRYERQQPCSRPIDTARQHLSSWLHLLVNFLATRMVRAGRPVEGGVGCRRPGRPAAPAPPNPAHATTQLLTGSQHGGTQQAARYTTPCTGKCLVEGIPGSRATPTLQHAPGRLLLA